MKVVTVNVNGIRSANSKGLFKWLETLDPDIICLQEIKALVSDIPHELINWNGYYSTFYPAQRKGYSGVAIFAKKEPKNITLGLGNKLVDDEGRYLQFDYEKFSVVSLYLPSGSAGPEKQEKKLMFMDYYGPILEANLKSAREYIICGDWNIAHQEIDLKNWKGNSKNSGFLPEERAWVGRVIGYGYLDVWRDLYKDVPGYTWWSNRGQAYAKDVGWRIDYHMCTPNIGGTATNAQIFKGCKFSDHAPLVVDYNIAF